MRAENAGSGAGATAEWAVTATRYEALPNRADLFSLALSVTFKVPAHISSQPLPSESC